MIQVQQQDMIQWASNSKAGYARRRYFGPVARPFFGLPFRSARRSIIPGAGAGFFGFGGGVSSNTMTSRSGLGVALLTPRGSRGWGLLNGFVVGRSLTGSGLNGTLRAGLRGEGEDAATSTRFGLGVEKYFDLVLDFDGLGLPPGP